MEAAFDPRTFTATRADLSARLGMAVTGLALLDSESKLNALDDGFADSVGTDAEELVGRPLSWVFAKLGLPKRTEPSSLMNSPMDLPNGQQIAMSLTADGLAVTLTGEPVAVEPQPAAEPVSAKPDAVAQLEPVSPPAPPKAVAPTTALEDFALALAACRDANDLGFVIESWLPNLAPGSRGTFAALLDGRAVVTSNWPEGPAKPTQFPADRCMALRLGHTFPEPGTTMPFKCQHGVDGICVPVTWCGEVLGVLSAESVTAERLTKIARLLAPYCSRLP